MRTKKAFKNIMASMLYQMVSIVCGLIAPRLLLINYGSVYNGVVSSATQMLSVVSVLTLGIAGATRVALYKSLANKDILATSRIMRANRNYMRKVAVVVVFYALALAIIYPFISHNSLGYSETAALILIVSISTIAEYMFGLSNQTLLSADQSIYIYYSIGVIALIVRTLLIVILVNIGASVFSVYLVSSVVFFVSPAVMTLYINKKFHLVKNCEPDNDALKGRSAVAFHSIANIVHENTDLVLLTVFTDATEISVYTVYYLVIGKVKMFMRVFTNGMESAFGDMWAKGEYDNLKKNFKSYEYTLFAFAAVVFSCVGVLIIPFLQRYTKGVNDVNYIRYTLAILITITEATYCIRHPYLTLVQATGNYEGTKYGALIEAIVNITVSLILVNFIGLNGVIIGTLIANLIRTTQFAIFSSRRILYRSLGEVVKRIVWLIVTSGTIISIALIVTNNLSFDIGWGGWIFEAIIVFLIALSVNFISSILFYREDFIHLLNTIFRMLHIPQIKRR